MLILLCMYRIHSAGDIMRNDYELEFYYDGKLNSKDSMISFNWILSKKAETMMATRFITGFQIIIEQQLDYSNNLTKKLTLNQTMETKDLTVNITLESKQWYLLIGRILTVDEDSWGPEAVYKYFETSGNLYTS